MYVYMYIYIYTYIYIYIHVCVCVFVCMCACVWWMAPPWRWMAPPRRWMAPPRRWTTPCVYVCVCLCLCVSVCTCTCLCMRPNRIQVFFTGSLVYGGPICCRKQVVPNMFFTEHVVLLFCEYHIVFVFVLFSRIRNKDGAHPRISNRLVTVKKNKKFEQGEWKG